jgi:hypothetical protein
VRRTDEGADRDGEGLVDRHVRVERGLILAAVAVSDDHLLPRFRRVELDHREQQLSAEVEKALREAAHEELVTANPHALALEAARLRGVLCVGKHSGGSAIAGTRPDRLDWVKRLRRRRRRL